MSIAAENIYKSFAVPGASKSVLAGASISVPDGAAACLMGQNGSGKTTLLKIISALALPDLGRVIISKPGLAYVGSGEGGFYEPLSLRENILFFCRLRGMADNVIKERLALLAKRFDIMPWLNEPVSHCSSGVRRKTAILLASLTKPGAYIIDEFSASLDETSRETVCAFLREEVAVGCSCLVVSHDPLDSQRLGAALYKLENGAVKTA